MSTCETLAEREKATERAKKRRRPRDRSTHVFLAAFDAVQVQVQLLTRKVDVQASAEAQRKLTVTTELPAWPHTACCQLRLVQESLAPVLMLSSIIGGAVFTINLQEVVALVPSQEPDPVVQFDVRGGIVFGKHDSENRPLRVRITFCERRDAPNEYAIRSLRRVLALSQRGATNRDRPLGDLPWRTCFDESSDTALSEWVAQRMPSLLEMSPRLLLSLRNQLNEMACFREQLVPLVRARLQSHWSKHQQQHGTRQPQSKFAVTNQSNEEEPSVDQDKEREMTHHAREDTRPASNDDEKRESNKEEPSVSEPHAKTKSRSKNKGVAATSQGPSIQLVINNFAESSIIQPLQEEMLPQTQEETAKSYVPFTFTIPSFSQLPPLEPETQHI